jgi:hypothetical protein
MGVQFDQLTSTPHRSLSFIVEDMSRAHRDGLFIVGDFADLEGWLNVLQHWSAPLVSDAGRRGIEHWLETVDAGGTAG